MKIRKLMIYLTVFLIYILAFSTKIHANELGVSGFGTVAVAISDSKVPYLNSRKISDELNFLSDTVIGLQFTGKAQNSFDYFIQIVAKDNIGHFDAKIDWIVASYRLNESIHLRGGKLRIPYFLLSKHVEVAYTYPWIRPPSEVYDLIEFTNYVGIDAIFKIDINDMRFSIRPIIGQTSDQLVRDSISGGPAEVLTEESFGFSIEGSFNLLKVQLSAFRADAVVVPNPAFTDTLSIISQFSPAPLPLPNNFETKTYVDIFSLGVRHEYRSYIFMSEIAQRNVDPQLSSNLIGYYIMLGKNINDYLVHLTFAVLESKEDPISTYSLSGIQEQQSTTLGIKFQLMSKASFHLDIQNIEPQNDTRGLFIAAQDTSTIISTSFNWIF